LHFCFLKIAHENNVTLRLEAQPSARHWLRRGRIRKRCNERRHRSPRFSAEAL
jgi:hypothetical protein